MGSWTIMALGTAALLLLGVGARADEELHTIPTRPGVSLPFLLVTPDRRPVASLILFAGGNGQLALSAWATGGGKRGNFLVRSRALFAEQGREPEGHRPADPVRPQVEAIANWIKATSRVQ